MTRFTECQAREFKQTFKANLSEYWQGILGFDVIKFDAEIVKSTPSQSCRDAVRQTYGTRAVTLINELLQGEVQS